MSATLSRKNLPENPTPNDILNTFLDYLTRSGKSLFALALQFKSLCQGRRSSS